MYFGILNFNEGHFVLKFITRNSECGGGYIERKEVAIESVERRRGGLERVLPANRGLEVVKYISVWLPKASGRLCSL